MFRIHRPVICLVIAFNLLPFASRLMAEDEPAPLFPDKNLDAAIREVALKHEPEDKELTEEDLRKVYFLDASGRGIKDLSGLERCPNLAQVNLAKNEISDLGPLADHPLLQWLDLSENQIEDLKPLASLEGMQYLNLEKNQIADLTPLGEMEKLSALYAAENKVQDVGPLAKIERLASLDLSSNEIEDIAPIGKLINLSLLNLNENKISDLKSLAAPVPARLLLLERNQITDLAPLVEMATADAAGPKRFAPYMNLYVAENPLSEVAKSEQIEALKQAGVRIKSL